MPPARLLADARKEQVTTIGPWSEILRTSDPDAELSAPKLDIRARLIASSKRGIDPDNLTGPSCSEIVVVTDRS
jgi:hypothetical protein